MASEHSIRRFRSGYATLLRLYPKLYRDRFGEPMEQTFGDLLRERAGTGGGLFDFALWMYAETFVGILRENLSVMLRNKSLVRIAIVTVCVLLVPLVAMQFTEEVDWTLFDFAFMGALVAGTGLAYELIARKVDRGAYRAAVGVALGAAFILIWVNGAVGVIGNENNQANLMFGGVLCVGLVGTILARFRPRGMARALVATAAAQALVAVIAVVGGYGADAPLWPGDVLIATGFFVALWLASASLFRRASVSA